MPLFDHRLVHCRAMPVLMLLTAAAVAQAQALPRSPAARTARPDPLDAHTRVPVATHTSALSSYRRLGDDKRIGWKEANETVNRIGGWRAYARDAHPPETAPPSPASRPDAASVPMPAPPPASGAAPAHGGHKTP